MRPAPKEIPNRLPDAEQAVRSIQREVLDRSDTRLTDLSIGQLILDLSDGTPAYLTGSNVWLRSVFGYSSQACLSGKRRCTEHARQVDCICQERLDYDVVFSSQESAEAFILRFISMMNRRIPKGMDFVRTENAFGRGRIIHPNGESIIDAWALEPGESIGELLMGFPERHQRSALHVSRSVSAGSLFRIIRADFDIERMSGARTTAAKMRDRYPGRSSGGGGGAA